METKNKKKMGRRTFKACLESHFNTSNAYTLIDKILSGCKTTAQCRFAFSVATDGKLYPSVNTVRNFLKAASKENKIRSVDLRNLITKEQRGLKKKT